LPSFESLSDVERYKNCFFEYQRLLQNAGISLPEQELKILKKNDNKYILYVKQEKVEGEKIGNKLIHILNLEEILIFLKKVLENLLKVYRYNKEQDNIKIGIDGQISNWAEKEEKILYLDTTSPLYRKNNIEQLDTEIFLKHTPSFLRIFIKKFFLKEVLDRYYDLRKIVIDLIANFFKEGKKEIIPASIKFANKFLSENMENFKQINFDEIKNYYKLDAFIWRSYQFSRRVDRFIITKILGKEYELLLPEKIRR
jgi:type III secretory pathway component EscV